MTNIQLDEITKKLIDDIFADEDLRDKIFDADEEMAYKLFSTIASLHNVLYKVVTGQYYDYMFHFTAYAGMDDDGLYKPILGDEHEI